MTISTSTSPPQSAVRELRSAIRGDLVTPSDEGYDAACQIWNGAVGRRPAVIVRCRDHDDVTTAVRFARTHELPLSVRGGGHDWAGRALNDGGLVVDLQALRGVTIDTEGSTATAQGGATAADVVAAAHPYGLAPVTGTVAAVGMVGLTLAGGYGPLNGKHGLALDNLLAADVVLADGRIVTASDSEEPDLYWALRGGGGNFGIVIAARYRLHQLTSVLAGMLLFEPTQAEAVLAGYQQIVAGAPDELTVMTGFLTGPDGQPLVFLFPTWSGEPQLGRQFIDQLTMLGTPVLAQVAPMAYEDVLGMFTAQVVNGRCYAIRTRWLAGLTQETAAILTEAASRASSPHSAIGVHHFHGAASRVSPTATAFPMRHDHVMVEIIAAWEPSMTDDGSTHRDWADTLSQRLAAHALPGGYPNLLGPEEPERLRLAYGPNATRLLECKQRYDPTDVFSSAVGALTTAGT